MNDNILKILVCFVAVAWVPDEYHDVVVNMSAGLLVLPYLIFSPLGGKLACCYGKLRVLRVSKMAELPIMLLAVGGILAHSVVICLTSVMLMGLQSALYSPSKYGLIKDIGGADGISEGMGGMEAIAFFGMLSGSVVAAFLVDNASEPVWYAVLIGLALLGMCNSLFVKAPKEKETARVSASLVKFYRESDVILRKYRGLKSVIHYLSVFWWISASLQILMILHCQEVLCLSAWHTGLLLALMAVGISVGCVLGGMFDRRLNLVGLAPLYGVALALLLILTFFCCRSLILFCICVSLVALVAGVFKIPLDAEIQKQVDVSELSPILAFFNQVSFVYIFLASATNLLVTGVCGLPTDYIFLVTGSVIFVVSIVFVFSYRRAICQLGHIILKTHYDITTIGQDVLRSECTNMLILPSHRAVLDPLLLFAELHSYKVQPLCDEGYFKIPIVKRVLGLFDAVEVPDLAKGSRDVDKVRGLKDAVVSSLREGGNILFYPSGHITTDGGESIGTRQLAYEACLHKPKHTRVIGVRICGLWGSRWSRYGCNSTPSLVALVQKTFLYVLSTAIFFMHRRKLTIEYVDITDRVEQWSSLTRIGFNEQLEQFYREAWGGGKEPAS